MTTLSTGVASFPAAAAFTLRNSATSRGARLARRLAWPYRTPVHDAVELIVGELAGSAVTHGRVPGTTRSCGCPTTARDACRWG